MKTFLNILRIIGAALLSIILFALLICIPVTYSVTSFVEEDVFTTVIQEVDVEEIIAESPELIEEFKNSGIEVETLDALFETEGVQEIIDLYIHDLFVPIKGEGELQLTEDKINEIIEEHFEDAIPLVKEIVAKQGVTLSEKEMKKYAKEYVSEFLTNLPTADDLGITEPETLQSIQMVQSGVFVYPLVIVAVVLSILVVICRFEKFEGFIWLAITYFLSGGITLLITNGIANLVKAGIHTTDAIYLAMIPALDISSQRMKMAGIVLWVLAIIFLVVVIVGTKYKKKKEENCVEIV